jgi:hypothetical protein
MVCAGGGVAVTAVVDDSRDTSTRAIHIGRASVEKLNKSTCWRRWRTLHPRVNLSVERW